MSARASLAVSRRSLAGEGYPNVLIVDDNAANLLAVEAILQPLGYRTVTVTSGEEALKQLLLQEFAVILMDVQMPGMDGFEAAGAIKAHPRTSDVPIIFITAISRDAAHVFKGYALGAVDYLLKPFDPEILRSKVAVFVDLYKKEEKIREQAKLLHQHEMRALQRRNDARYQGLTASMPLPMWRVQTDGTVCDSNRAWHEYAGIAGVAPAGTSNFLAGDFMLAEDAEKLRAHWQSQIWQADSFDFGCRLRRADGVYRWHLLRMIADRSEKGVLHTWIVTATDNDAQKKAHEVAEEANRIKDDFLATVSHELRTPLNAILGWSRMLRAGTLDEARTARALEAIERNAQVQTELVNDILDVSRIISGKLRLQIGPLALPRIVEDGIETLRAAAEAKGVELVSNMEGWTPCEVFGDSARVQQVLWNLLTNAVKFTGKGGRVTAGLRVKDAHAEITVSDTGKGISPEFLPFVFDRFRQADSSLTREYTGLGLGLAIVRHLVELHGGRVNAESTVGVGSTFTVRLPVGGADVRATEPEWLDHDAPKGRMAIEPPSLKGVTVLLVEDTEDARDMVTLLLEQYGAKVTAVDSADQALEAIACSVPDVIVSDIGLPHKDGYALIRAISALAPESGGQVPAIAVTGYARVEDGKRALAEGFQMHLAKPVEPNELVALVANVASRSR